MTFRGNRIDQTLHWEKVLSYIAICVLVSLAAVGISYRLFLLLDGGVVSGTDPGNWLAYANKLTGESTKASDSTYPPLIPLIVVLLSWATSKMMALSIVGIIAAIIPTLALFFSLKGKSEVIVSVLASVGFLFCVMSTEILAWGGYPQAISQTFLVISMSLLARDIHQRSRRRMYLVAFCGSLCIGSWVPGLLFLGLSFSMYFCCVLFWVRPYPLRNLLMYGIRIVLLIGMFSLPYAIFYFDSREIMFLQSWNPQHNSVSEWEVSLSRLFRGWPGWLIVIFWTMTFVTVLLTFAYRCGVRAKNIVILFCSLFITSLVVYGFTMELRSLNLAMIAGWGLWGASLIALRSTKFFQTKFYFVLLGCLVFFVLSLMTINTKQSSDIFSYYRVVDHDVKLALDWININAEEGDVVVETGNKHGFQYIWWLEGYAMLPSMSATDNRFFSFEEERTQVKLAINLLHKPDQQLKRRLLEEHQITWVFHDKNVLIDIDALKALGFVTVFDSLRIRIMKRS